MSTRGIVAVVCALVAWTGGRVNLPAGEPPIVHYASGRVTVRADDAPVAAILGELARQSGAVVRGPVPSTTVSADFTDVPLAEALSRLLSEGGFLLRYEGPTVRAIEVLPVGAPVAPLSPTPLAAQPTPTGLAEAERQAAILQRPVVVGGVLADALGTTTPSAGTILHGALQSPSAETRAAARQAIVAAFEADGEMEAAYLSTLEPVADETLASIFRRTSSGDGAEQLMDALAHRARSSALRAKAARVLSTLRTVSSDGAD